MKNDHTVPAVSVTSITGDRFAVVITRSGHTFEMEVGDGNRTAAETVAAEIRGALAAAFHAGAHEEHVELNENVYGVAR